ncbi:hypothetical protein FF011L_31020 [Roseimaritima multifibrata]|uniref:Glycosyl hydrolase family 32 N-terminal domain-containing protein n=1 Tax=Roseimaritima multifibrata TaxID=1930274 RepID=A0A517MHG7_9BACT|nr:hypothetical protein [Roseimaritima multifibrata]QDS94323.1 hypothetical protein FF011L_31020 [Roseimaritima multifibrata]
MRYPPCAFFLCLAVLFGNVLSAADLTVQQRQRVAAPEAHQAVAVDAASFFAISNQAITRYDKSTNEPLVAWKAEEDAGIKHLNSGVVVDGRLYCAHSNWPATPLNNTIEVFDAESLKHLESLPFEKSTGAINWVDRHRDSWWVVYAFYGADEAARTKLIRYDDDWKPIAEFTFPENVVKRFLPNSNSGGSFGPNGRLFVTGHDHPELYVLDVPAESGTLTYKTTIAAPITGQGIAWDRSDIGTLFGIDRRQKEVVSMRLSHSDEYAELQRSVEWIRHPDNPVIPPREGEFDSYRCMNPWAVREGNQYRVYYSGAGADRKQRLAYAVADVDDLTDWKRTEPLFDTGAAGAFDALWCVLPHAIQTKDKGWNLYYTGNSGKGAGLSAFPGIGVATSKDGLNWKRYSEQPVLSRSMKHGDPDAIGIAGGSVQRLRQEDGTEKWFFYYTGCPTIGTTHELHQQKTICLAVSDDGIEWTKKGVVMTRNPDRDYENIAVAGPVVLQDPDGLFRMWYSAIGSRHMYYSICYAESDDGIHWRRGPEVGDNLQLLPTGNGWEKQMVEYPSVLREGDHLRLFYCGNGYGRAGIGTAVSK